MDKVKNTDLDEQYVAFALIDSNNFMLKLWNEDVISDTEYEKIKKFLITIEQRCGFNQEE